jgi:hypothetical protein
VVPLCPRCHRLYDDGAISILEHLEPHYRAELAYAVVLVGLVAAIERTTNERWAPWRTSSLSMMEPSGEPFSGTWPRSGLTWRGTAFPLPPSAPRTAVTGSSPLLPTPDASVANYAEDPDKWQARADLLKVKHGNGNGTPLAVAVKMLPTPRSSDMNGAGVHGQGGMDLRTAMQLLPTPTARGVKDTGAPAEFDRKSPELLPTTLKLLPTPRADPRDATARR